MHLEHFVETDLQVQVQLRSTYSLEVVASEQFEQVDYHLELADLVAVLTFVESSSFVAALTEQVVLEIAFAEQDSAERIVAAEIVVEIFVEA